MVDRHSRLRMRAELKVRLAILVSLAILSLLIVPGTVFRVHAATTGLVCLADGSSAPSPPSNPCPTPLPIFSGPVNQQIRIGVFVNGSEGIYALDVTLETNSTFLKPSGFDLTGSILASPLVVAECLGTLNVTTAACNSADDANSFQLALASFSPTPTPSTGLLFTAIYNITATSSSAMTFGFQSGCTTTSVAGTSTCVVFSNGSISPAPETVQSATFNNTIAPPFITVHSDTLTVGPVLVSTVGSLRLNLTGQNGWDMEACPCTATLSAVGNKSLTVLFNSTSPGVPAIGSVFVRMDVKGTIAGNFSITVHAQYPTVDLQNGDTDTLVTLARVSVVVTDFAISTSAVGLQHGLVGVGVSSPILINGLNGFSGMVVLSSSSSTGQCSLSPSSIVVVGSGSSSLKCSLSYAANYNVTVTGKSGTVSHTVQVGFSVQDFAVSLGSKLVSVVSGSSGTVSLNVTGLNGFSGLVSLVALSPSGLTVTPMSASFLAPNTVSLSFVGTAVGVYSVNITVSAAPVTRFVVLQVNVTAPAPSSSLFGLAPSLFYSIVVGLVVLIAVAVLVITRHRSRTAKSRSAATGKTGRTR